MLPATRSASVLRKKFHTKAQRTNTRHKNTLCDFVSSFVPLCETTLTNRSISHTTNSNSTAPRDENPNPSFACDAPPTCDSQIHNPTTRAAASSSSSSAHQPNPPNLLETTHAPAHQTRVCARKEDRAAGSLRAIVSGCACPSHPRPSTRAATKAHTQPNDDPGTARAPRRSSPS